MKAQATIEFLLSFLLSIAVVSILSAALLAASKSTEMQPEKVRLMMALEEVARTEDSVSVSGAAIAVRVPAGNWSVQDNSVKVAYGGGTITIEGLFNVYPYKGEPV